jgi:hypothetical protein
VKFACSLKRMAVCLLVGICNRPRYASDAHDCDCRPAPGGGQTALKKCDGRNMSRSARLRSTQSAVFVRTPYTGDELLAAGGHRRHALRVMALVPAAHAFIVIASE